MKEVDGHVFARGVSMEYRRQSTEGYAHDGRLCGRGACDQELDGNTSTET